MNKIVLWVLAIIGIVIAYNVLFVKKEYIENVSSTSTEKSEKAKSLAKAIMEYLKPETEYTDYLDFLVKNNNSSYKVLEQESFFEMKMLLKMKNLTSDVILREYLSDSL
jgi:hypothetical protein